MYRYLGALMLAVLVSGLAFAQAPDAKRTVAEQKLKLLESVLKSPRVQQAAGGEDGEARTQIEKARQLHEQAKAALAGGDVEAATVALDQAMRAVSAASAAKGAANLNLSAERARNSELAEQVKSYRASLMQSRKDGGPAVQAALDKVDRLSGEAEKLSAAGKYAEANKLLAEAYTAAISALSAATAGKTVTLALKFDTPADEYAYEQKRFQSHEMLVDMMVGEGRAEGDKRQLVDRYVGEGRKLRGQAEGEAKGNNYAVAIKTMEQATAQLVRALVTMGVPIF